MLLNQRNVRLTRIIRYTWKVDVWLVFTCSVVFLVHEYVIPTTVDIPATLVTLLGTALAFFVGFNNNQSYDRWWEARSIWGALVNDSRSWARNVLSYVTPGDLAVGEVSDIKKRLVRRQLAFVYALKDALRRKAENYFEKFLGAEDLAIVRRETNIPNAILTLNARDLQVLSERKSVDQFRFAQMNNLLTAMTDHMGKSERIRSTVFPTSYIYFTQVFIWILVVFITLSLAETMGLWSILVAWIIGAVFHITHLNGMGLVDPFDEVPTGVALNQISRTIEINLLQMLDEKEIPEPVQVINDEYVL